MTVEIKVDFSGFDEKAILKEVEKNVAAQLRRVRCPVHHQTPTVRSKRVGSKMEWEITGCCEKVIEQAQRVLN
jgi:DNA-directed RNA polymerase sigma subunit (sigma70/sigma32)